MAREGSGGLGTTPSWALLTNSGSVEIIKANRGLLSGNLGG